MLELRKLRFHGELAWGEQGAKSRVALQGNMKAERSANNRSQSQGPACPASHKTKEKAGLMALQKH
jgi:hypothetical protein